MASEITAEILRATDDWDIWYSEQGAAMLGLAETLIGEKSDESIELALKIIAGAYSEEEDENPESEPMHKDIDFERFVKPLAELLSHKKHAPLALHALWVCCREGASVKLLESKDLEHVIGSQDKTEERGMPIQELAFRILVHVACQKGEQEDLSATIKTHKAYEEVLFDELGAYAAHAYDQKPFIGSVLENLKAKGEARVRGAVETLWRILMAGADIGEVVSFLTEHQSKLGMFTDSNRLLAGYFLKEKKYAELQQWLSDTDPVKVANAYRGLFTAHKNGISAEEFMQQPGVMDRLNAISAANIKLNTPQEYLSSPY